MGKLTVTVLRYLEPLDFRILTAIEVGMKKHELVPGPVVIQLANVRAGGVHKKLMELCRHRLCCYERGKNYDGYRLTNLGYDYLSLKVLISRDIIHGMGSQIGVGKESDIYVVVDKEGDKYCMKIHRLGRTSFRKVKEKRDYHGNRTKAPWIYLSRLSATKEFAFMTALHEHGFPVPRPLDFNRHIIVMELVDGYPLCQVRELSDPGQLYSELMELIVRLANHGVIHSDFNEFNIMVDEHDKPVLIDFPQMVSTEHQNAQMYFERDVRCVAEFFKRRFEYESELKPDFHTDVVREFDLDKEVEASGYLKEVRQFYVGCGDTDDTLGADQVQCSESDDETDSSYDEEEENVQSKCTKNLEGGDDTKHTDIDFEPIKSDTHNKGIEDNNDTICKEIEDSSNGTYNEEIKDNSTRYDEESHSHHPRDPSSDSKQKDIQSLDSKADRPPSPTQSVISKCSTNRSRALSPSSRTALISEMANMRVRRQKGELEDNISLLDFACEFMNEGGRALSHVSGSTSVSTIPVEEIKKRTKKDLQTSLYKQKCSKKSLRVKGEANAFNRQKKDNMQVIKESVGWDKDEY